MLGSGALDSAMSCKRLLRSPAPPPRRILAMMRCPEARIAEGLAPQKDRASVGVLVAAEEYGSERLSTCRRRARRDDRGKVDARFYLSAMRGKRSIGRHCWVRVQVN